MTAMPPSPLQMVLLSSKGTPPAQLGSKLAGFGAPVLMPGQSSTQVMVNKQPPNLQMVTLVAKGGTPVLLADQTGAPFPTTGTGALVFADGPVLNDAQFTGSFSIDSVLTNDGNAVVPAIAFQNDPDTGIYSSGDGSWSVSSNGVQMFDVTPSGIVVHGNVTYSGQLVGAYHDPLTNQGDLYYRGPTGSTRLPLGLAGTVLLSDGNNAIWGAPPSGIVIGSTTIGAGTNGYVLFDNVGRAGEYPITGTAGNVVMSEGPTIHNPTITGTPVIPGMLTGITAGTGITVTGTAPSPTVALTNQIVAAGPVGDASHVAQITFNAQGQLTAVTAVAISASGIGGLTGITAGTGITVTGGAPSPTVNVDPTYLSANYLPLAGGTLTGPLNTRAILPSSDNASTLGDATHRWSGLYAMGGTFSGALMPSVDNGSGMMIGDISHRWQSITANVVSAGGGGMYVGGVGVNWIALNGVNNGDITSYAPGRIGFSSSNTNAALNPDTYLVRDGAAGLLGLRSSATIGVDLDVSVDGTVKLRTRGNAGDANITAGQGTFSSNLNLVSAGIPLQLFSATGNATDQKVWRAYEPSAGTFIIEALSDASAVQATYTFQRNGVLLANGAPVGGAIAVGTTPPASPAANALWWNSDGVTGGGQLYLWYNDGNTTQWVPAAAAAQTPSFVAFTAFAAAGVFPTTIAKLALSSPAVNVGGGVWDATNNRWTPPAGTYLITAAASFTTTGAASGLNAALYKNGVQIALSNNVAAAAGFNASAVIAVVVQANGTDYFELWANTGVASIGISTAGTYLSAYGR